MITKRRSLCSLVICCAMALAISKGQSPSEIVVQAASPTNTSAVVAKQPATAATGSAAVQAALNALQQEKAANAETLRRQKIVLEQLAELEKATNELKLFIHRS